MKYIRMAFVLLVLCPFASAQVWIQSQGGGGSTFNGGAVTNPLLLPNGTQALPGLGWASEVTMGLYRSGSQTSFYTAEDAGTNTTIYPFSVQHSTSGTATTNFGVGQQFWAENASGTNRQIGSFECYYTDATNASEDSHCLAKVMNGGTPTTAFETGLDLGIQIPGTMSYVIQSRVQMYAPISRVLALADGNGVNTGWFRNTGGSDRITADVPNATVTMTNITGISSDVFNGSSYSGEYVFRVDDSTAAEGVRFDWDGGSTTVSAFWAACSQTVGGTVVVSNAISTALATDIIFTTITGDTYIVCKVSFTPNGSGTLIPRVAQSTHAAGTVTVRAGSYAVLNDNP